VKVENTTKENKYIQSVLLNGEPLNSPFISHQDIINGAILQFAMGSKPSQWGIVE
jgi:putative alpha-1,2-mannosidase